MVRFAMQTFPAPSLHPPAKRARIESLLEIPSSAPLSTLHEERQIAATLDPDTLDCHVCFEPLASPIFQCSNGHTACSSCCQKLKSVCASCSKPIGKIRCLAIEKLIESLHMHCRYAEYGCVKMLKFSKKKAHETSCPYAPFKCPIAGCHFSGAGNAFPDHFNSSHQTRTVDFQYDSLFTVVLNPSDYHVVLKAEDMVFLLHYEKEAIGNMIYVTFFGQTSREEFFSYHLSVKSGKTMTNLDTVPRSILQEDKRGTSYIVVPKLFNTNSEGPVQIQLSFHHPGEAISGLQINP